MAKNKRFLAGINTIPQLIERNRQHHLVYTWLEKYGLKAKGVIVIWTDENGQVRMATACGEDNLVALGMLAAANNLVFCGEVDDDETIEQDEDNVA